MKFFKEKFILIVIISFTMFSSFFVGEGLIRLFSVFYHSYIIEMIKCSHELIMNDPDKVLTKVNKPFASIKVMNIDFTLNSLGHRNPELEVPKPQNEKRIYILGASETFGWGVEQEKTFSSRLEKNLNKPTHNPFNFKVVNAGVINYSVDDMNQLLKNQFNSVKADLVIINYYFSDKILRKQKNYLTNEFYLINFLTAYYELLVTNHYIKRIDKVYTPSGEVLNKIIKNFHEIKKFCDENNVPLKIVMLPDLRDLKHNSINDLTFQNLEKKLRTEGFTDLINLWTPLQIKFENKEDSSWVSNKDAHPNELVHQIIADEITQNLNSTQLFK